MPLTYSIATGIGLGFITYTVVKILAGKWKEASPAVMALAVLVFWWLQWQGAPLGAAIDTSSVDVLRWILNENIAG